MKHTSLAVLAMILVCLVGFDYLNAWTVPTEAPPEGNVAAPLNVGAQDQLKTGGIGAGSLAIFGESYFADVVKATSSVWAAAYCDRTGANCFVPGAVTEINETAAGGNEIVYLSAPRELYPPSQFRTTSNVNRSYNFSVNGYPSNIVRAYITSNGGGKPSTSYDCGDSTCTSPAIYPRVSYYAPFETAAYAFITHTGAVTRKGEWLDVRNSQLDFVINCGTTNCGTTANYTNAYNVMVSTNVELSGYECAGACVYSAVELCTINFNYTIQGTSGATSREVIGGGGEMGIGLWNHHDDNISYNLPYTEHLFSRSWGGSTFDSSEKAGVGFFDKNQYSRNLSLLQSRDGSANYEVAPLTLTVGSTVSISNDASNDIPAGTARMTATVASCRIVGG